MGSSVELGVAMIIETLEDYAAHLHAMRYVQEAEELNAFAGNYSGGGAVPPLRGRYFGERDRPT